MDHIVFITRSSAELKELLSGERCMIVRGSLGKRAPYGKVSEGDTLFFAIGNGYTKVRATATAGNVHEPQKLAPEKSESLISDHQEQLQLNSEEKAKWSKKKYLTFIEVADVSPVVPFTIAVYGSGENDDWEVLPDIDAVIE